MTYRTAGGSPADGSASVTVFPGVPTIPSPVTATAGVTGRLPFAASRSAGRTIAKVARRRRVRYVVMDDSAPSGVRRVTEGAVTATVRRRLGAGATLELVGPGARIS